MHRLLVWSLTLAVSALTLSAQSRETPRADQQPSVKLAAGETPVAGECLTKQELDLNRGLLALTRPTRGAESQQDADDPPRFNPQYLVGTWTVEGILPESPLGPAGEIGAIETVRHLRDCTYEATLTAKGTIAFTTKSLIVYDRHASYMVRIEQDSRGFQLLKTGSVGGDTGGYFSHHWQAADVLVKGKRVRLQGTSFFASPDNYRLRMQIAVDDQPPSAFGTIWWRRKGN
jgi:hypothetical protein